MDNEKFQELVLSQLQTLTEGQTKLEQGIKELEKGQMGIKNELRYMWEDIKKIDARLTKQEEETALLKSSK